MIGGLIMLIVGTPVAAAALVLAIRESNRTHRAEEAALVNEGASE